MPVKSNPAMIKRLIAVPKTLARFAELHDLRVRPALDGFAEALIPSKAGIAELVIPPRSVLFRQGRPRPVNAPTPMAPRCWRYTAGATAAIPKEKRMRKKLTLAGLLTALWAWPVAGWVAEHGAGAPGMAHSGVGYTALGLFIVAYLLVMAEEFTHLRKSKPVLLAAGLIWALIAWASTEQGHPAAVEHAARENLLDYAELMLFLLVAMTYINAMEERRVFDSLRAWLVRRGFSYRQLFWMTGTLAFFISPVADNLTTALLMCAVVLTVGAGSPRFIGLACINIVVAANAGGAFSPFGDITTLMVWQAGKLEFWAFFALFLPSVVNFVVPAAIMHFALPAARPAPSDEVISTRRGARRMIALFMLTIATAVTFHNFLGLPPVLGMLTGLAYLQIFGFFLRMTHHRDLVLAGNGNGESLGEVVPFDVFNKVARAEWDTLLFFYGVVMCVGGLGFLGYLSIASEVMYTHWGATTANVTVGVLSAIIDNIPIMFAVLSMDPTMADGQWMLITLTAGVGGSLLSIGSAAGVALMGQARGVYTFFTHLRWAPAVAAGYGASILTHMMLNASHF